MNNQVEQARKSAKRIRELMDSLGMNPSEFARFIGLPNGQSQVRRWAGGDAVPSSRNAALIAAKGNGDPGHYQGLDTASGSPTVPEMIPVPYGGDLQAGMWREAITQEFDEGKVFPLPFHIAAPWRDLHWFYVKGESMNLKYPSGSVVIAASIFTNPIEPANGSDVIVQRKSVDGTYETTIKEFARDGNGKTWLIPRSTEPEFQAPINLSEGNHEGEDVLVTGVVIYEFKTVFQPAGKGAQSDRTSEIMARHLRGESHASIGADYGMSRERVRQIVAAQGGQPRSKQREQRAQRLTEMGKPKETE